MSDKETIGGWAHGHYQNRCYACEGLFIGAKLAVQCEPCALRARIAELRGAAREFLEIEDDLRGFDGDKRGMLDALHRAKDRLRAALREGEG